MKKSQTLNKFDYEDILEFLMPSLRNYPFGLQMLKVLKENITHIM
jgi:hypothetical protein